MKKSVADIKNITNRVSIKMLGVDFRIRVDRDQKQPKDGRIFIQYQYESSCSKSNRIETWNSRKWYLSDHMTEDEIVKTLYLAFEICVRHEILEAFKIDGMSLFNPHTDYQSILLASKNKITRWRFL